MPQSLNSSGRAGSRPGDQSRSLSRILDVAFRALHARLALRVRPGLREADVRPVVADTCQGIDDADADRAATSFFGATAR